MKARASRLEKLSEKMKRRYYWRVGVWRANFYWLLFISIICVSILSVGIFRLHRQVKEYGAELEHMESVKTAIVEACGELWLKEPINERDLAKIHE